MGNGYRLRTDGLSDLIDKLLKFCLGHCSIGHLSSRDNGHLQYISGQMKIKRKVVSAMILHCTAGYTGLGTTRWTDENQMNGVLGQDSLLYDSLY